jgi:hypothetical protein
MENDFPATLRMPDQAGAVLWVHRLTDLRHCPLYKVIYCFELLVASNLLGDLTLLRLKDNEVLKKIEGVAGLKSQQAFDRRFSGPSG